MILSESRTIGLSTRAMRERYGPIKAGGEEVGLWIHEPEALAHHGSDPGLRLQPSQGPSKPWGAAAGW
jgi:hypothetical protein